MRGPDTPPWHQRNAFGIGEEGNGRLFYMIDAGHPFFRRTNMTMKFLNLTVTGAGDRWFVMNDDNIHGAYPSEESARHAVTECMAKEADEIDVCRLRYGHCPGRRGEMPLPGG